MERRGPFTTLARMVEKVPVQGGHGKCFIHHDLLTCASCISRHPSPTRPRNPPQPEYPQCWTTHRNAEVVHPTSLDYSFPSERPLDSPPTLSRPTLPSHQAGVIHRGVEDNSLLRENRNHPRRDVAPGGAEPWAESLAGEGGETADGV